MQYSLVIIELSWAFAILHHGDAWPSQIYHGIGLHSTHIRCMLTILFFRDLVSVLSVSVFCTSVSTLPTLPLT